MLSFQKSAFSYNMKPSLKRVPPMEKVIWSDSPV